MEFINWEQGRKSELFKGSTCFPTLGGPRHCFGRHATTQTLESLDSLQQPTTPVGSSWGNWSNEVISRVIERNVFYYFNCCIYIV